MIPPRPRRETVGQRLPIAKQAFRGLSGHVNPFQINRRYTADNEQPDARERMTDSRTTLIDSLRKRIEQLETDFKTLDAKHNRAVDALAGYDQLLNQHCKLLDKEMTDAFERIKYLEVKVYPGLLDDITQIENVIGEADDKALNPLDSRDGTKYPSKK